MKRYIIVLIFLFLAAALLPAKEYSYLTPPTISVMDFEVNIEEPLVEGNEGVPVDKGYYGELINHALVTVLIKKNNDYTLLIPRDPLYGAVSQIPGDPNRKTSGEGAFPQREAKYFPPLLKIYDKKYVETALAENNYTVADLYNKAPDAFNFPDLDFVVLGNVFDYGNNQLGINVRVLNTYRGEELFSYTQTIQKNMQDLYLSCDRIARGIISDILKNYCSQFIVKHPTKDWLGVMEYDDPALAKKVKGSEATRRERDRDAGAQEEMKGSAIPKTEDKWYVFCQSRQEKDNTGNIISYNDTYKKRIEPGRYYWILPGTYVITVYNTVNQAVHEINFTVNPREIYPIQLEEEHFETEAGSITIRDMPPTVSYTVTVEEAANRDPKYIWEIGDYDRLRAEGNKTEVDFIEGKVTLLDEAKDIEDEEEAEEKEGIIEPAIWGDYNAARNELAVTNLPLTQYKVTLKSNPTRGGEYINGILHFRTNGIKSYETKVDLREEREIVLDFPEFGLTEEVVEDAYKRTRITFLVNPAFGSGWFYFGFNDGNRLGDFDFWGFEKIVVESLYTEEEWSEFSNLSFEIKNYKLMGSERPLFYSFKKEQLLAERDYIQVVDMASEDVVRKQEEKKGFLQRLFGK